MDVAVAHFKTRRRPGEKWVSRVPHWTFASADQRALLEAAWRAGDLSFLLTPSQHDSYKKIRRWEKRGQGRVYALDIARRWGKSVLCAVLALEDAFRYPGFRIVYVAPTYEMVKKILLPLIAKMTESCPPSLQPEWIKSEAVFTFPNGSRLELVGLDLRPDGARGTGVDKVILDEAGFFDNLEYLLVSVIFPQMLGREHARIIAASTPPLTPQHYWSSTVVPECMARDAHDRKTLDEADQYTPEEIEYFYSLMPGGRNGTAARREYGAEHVADSSLLIVPEFAEGEQLCVREVEPPVWRDCYTSLDPGFHDLSAALFGYWHFLEETLVIEDEFTAPRLNSREIANRIRRKEGELWGKVRRRGIGFETKPQPYLRICDRDMRLITDLQKDYGLAFIATQRDHQLQQVDQIRVAVQTGKIAIHPRCKKLISHLKNGVWKKIPTKQTGNEFGRESEFGHFDLIAALVYMWRNVHKRRNPTPPLERFVCGDLPSNDNGKAPGPKSKWRREGQRWFLRSGRVG